MANAHETLQAQIEAATWVFVRQELEQWRRNNPGASSDDFVDYCLRQTKLATDRLIEVEMENGSSREEAERMIQHMH
ncbi:hypothetical protein ACFUJR_14665 [Streptomyces sp. NPDC057271]|uniref:hypothetical protein n=1 Tax=unclassified Streptomyces TaxID=2593676 RepID=UPI00363564C5